MPHRPDEYDSSGRLLDGRIRLLRDLRSGRVRVIDPRLQTSVTGGNPRGCPLVHRKLQEAIEERRREGDIEEW
jgi:hypothetical protein